MAGEGFERMIVRMYVGAVQMRRKRFKKEKSKRRMVK